MNARSYAAARNSARPSAGQVFRHAISAVSGKVTALVRILLNRRVAGQLQHLSDHDLADIGLTRDDLRHGLSMPFTADPTAELARRAKQNAYR